jgi:hypothetical protein
MKQRFYYKNYETGRWFVFMGNEVMEQIGSGLLVQEVGYEEAAKRTVHEYTRLFNDMVASEDCQITEAL